MAANDLIRFHILRPSSGVETATTDPDSASPRTSDSGELEIRATALGQYLGCVRILVEADSSDGLLETVPRLTSLHTVSNLVLEEVGGELLREAERLLREQGFRRWRATFEQDEPGSAAFTALLQRHGFSRPQLWGYSYLIEYHGDREWEGPWQRSSLLPAAFRIGFWRDVTDEEKHSIRQRQATCPWYPEDLSPFKQEYLIEAANSMVLRDQGTIAGWQINHRHDEETVGYTVTFVREDLQPFGLALALLREANRHHPPGCRSVFGIRKDKQAMIRLVEKYEGPYIDNKCSVMECFKAITFPDP